MFRSENSIHINSSFKIDGDGGLRLSLGNLVIKSTKGYSCVYFGSYGAMITTFKIREDEPEHIMLRMTISKKEKVVENYKIVEIKEAGLHLKPSGYFYYPEFTSLLSEVAMSGND